ncbi:MAG: PKD domain-containing protein, partial [Anaerolineales bacterium]|nr:PKD domain-containing protein [Anaerolineales bacterium]
TYTLTISSYAGTAVTYALAASGLADVTLPPSVNVSGGSASLSFQATPPQAGPQPFTVWATGDNGARDGADAVAEGQGRFGVTAALSQTTVTAGPATPALFDLFVTNAGTLPDTYALSVQAPAGWTAELLVNGTAVGQISPPPGPFATAQLALRVTPDANAAVGPAVVTVTAQSLANSGTRAVAAGTVIVGSRGVTVEFLSGPAAVDPSGTATWQVEVTNTGSAADSYDLLAAGYIAAFAQFTPASVSLNPGQSQTVQLTASGFGGALPEPVSVVAAARSQADPGIVGQDVTTLSFNAVEAVMMAWRPVTQTVVNELTAQFALVITNTGNVNTEYRINTSVPGASSQVALRRIPIPAQQSAVLLVDVEVPAGGTYVLGATAVSASGNASASAAATLIVLAGNQPPAVDAGPPQTAEVLELVQFAGTAVDPEGDAIVRIDWDFGDGQTASGTLTPTHTYLLPGDFQVTLTVEDDQGNVATDTVTITVTGAVEFFPIIFNGS